MFFTTPTFINRTSVNFHSDCTFTLLAWYMCRLFSAFILKTSLCYDQTYNSYNFISSYSICTILVWRRIVVAYGQLVLWTWVVICRSDRPSPSVSPHLLCLSYNLSDHVSFVWNMCTYASSFFFYEVTDSVWKIDSAFSLHFDISHNIKSFNSILTSVLRANSLRNIM